MVYTVIQKRIQKSIQRGGAGVWRGTDGLLGAQVAHGSRLHEQGRVHFSSPLSLKRQQVGLTTLEFSPDRTMRARELRLFVGEGT